MGIDATLALLVERSERLEKAVEALKPKREDDSILITTKQAGNLIGSSSEYIRALQDKGELDLVFLPGSKHRRVKKFQLLELIEKNTPRKAKKV